MVSIASPPAASVAAMISAASGCFAPSAREGDDLGQAAAVARLGQDPQALGEEQAFRAPRLLVAQRAQQLDGGVGKGGDLAGHHSSPKRSSTSATSFAERFLGIVALDMDDDRVAHRRAEHHQAHDRGAADAVAVLLDLDRGVDLAGEVDELGAGPGMEPALVARSGPRGWPRSSRGFPEDLARRRRYICGRPRARRRRRRGPASPCARPRAGSASAGSRRR